MGWIQDLLQEVPLSGVLRERLALAEQKFKNLNEENESNKKRVIALEEEIRKLRSELPAQPASLASRDVLGDDTKKVLIELFRANSTDERGDHYLASKMRMDRGMLRYHLDELNAAGFARRGSSSMTTGESFWNITPAGRKHAVENKLV
jgi:hypothetical protein